MYKGDAASVHRFGELVFGSEERRVLVYITFDEYVVLNGFVELRWKQIE